MAPTSRSRGHGSRAQAPPADEALLAAGPQLNTDFVAMPATELVGYLNRNRRAANFMDAAVVFAARERRLAVVEDRADRLQEELRARDAQIRRAAKAKDVLRAENRALKLKVAKAEAQAARARHAGSGVTGRRRGRRLTQQAGGHGREAEVVVVGHDVPRTRVRDGLPGRRQRAPRIPAASEQANVTAHGVGFNNNPPRMSHHSLRMNPINAPIPAASKQPRPRRRCWSNAPYLPSKPAAIELSSDED